MNKMSNESKVVIAIAMWLPLLIFLGLLTKFIEKNRKVKLWNILE